MYKKWDYYPIYPDTCFDENVTMVFIEPAEKFCPSCTGALPVIATFCAHCGKDLRKDGYQILSDGSRFGISLKGLIVIHDLELKSALEVASILNNYIQD